MVRNQNRPKVKKLSKRDLSRNRLENFKKEVDTDQHSVNLETLIQRLGTSKSNGLTPAQAKDILAKTGPNALTPATKEPEFKKFMKHQFHGFSILLWLGAMLCFIAYFVETYHLKKNDIDNLILGAALIVVVMLTGIFSYCQEAKSSKVMDSFKNMIPSKANVIRNGVVYEINTQEVVIGDIVKIKGGDRIPADVRLIECSNLKVDNSGLTGESEPQPRGTTYTSDNILETKNICFFSTNALEGTGTGVVIACGDQTVMGRIAGLTSRLKPRETPLALELKSFMCFISIWAISLGVVFGIVAAAMGYKWIEACLFLIGIIVANVPEGLMPTVTVSLTLCARRMAARNCLIKNLQSVETLGSTSVICSDKTGTLTQNVMTVHNIWFDSNVFPVDFNQTTYPFLKQASFQPFLRCATLCNRAEFMADQDNIHILHKRVSGDASEVAILKFVEMMRRGISAQLRQLHPKLIEVPFTSANKYQLSIHPLQDGTCLLVLKGAPERVVSMCSSILINGVDQPFSAELRNRYEQACLRFATEGERVLAFADLVLEERYTVAYPFSLEPPNFPQTNLRLLGLISLIDPPRPQVLMAVEHCRSAGIRVIMVTGDHPVTGKAIAKSVGIITTDKILELSAAPVPDKRNYEAIVVHGSALKDLENRELDEILYNYKEIVFARTSPTQKLQIVEGCQRLGEIVAVTGDGVNDSPALKKADIGIAMGITGTEVSHQSADIILLDDNFASIVVGIEEGRRIYDNLKKAIVYILTSNVPENIPFLMFIILKIPLPLGIIAILCIDLGTDLFPAISLAYEKAEKDIMKRPPRNPAVDKFVNSSLFFHAFGHLGIIEVCAGFITYFAIMAEYGFFPGTLLGILDDWENENGTVKNHFGQEWNFKDRKKLEYTCHTAFFMAIVESQWFNLMCCKTRYNSLCTQGMGNWMLNVSLLVETAIALLLIYLPFMHYLKLYPLHWNWWFYPLPFAVMLLVYDEIRKYIIRKNPRGYFRRETYY